MTYLFDAIKPTRIYHKQCEHCGLNYLGKSTLDNIENYQGSGVYWQRHLKKHNAKSIHVWDSNWFYDTSIVDYALNLSEELNIVESKEWANMKPENGLDGGWDHLPDNIQEITASKRGKSQSVTKKGKEYREIKEPQRVEKFQKWFEDTEWLNNKIKKELETKNDREWIEQNWKTCPHCNIYCDPSNFGRWHGDNCKKISTHSDFGSKISSIRNSKEYKEKHYKDCPYCNKRNLSPSMFSRWHDDNCKERVRTHGH